MTLDNDLSRLQLKQRELEEVRRLLKLHVPTFAVWAFGSRITGQARKYSDLDLVIITETPLNLAKRADLTVGFSESDLGFKVDIVDWSLISPEFRAIIEKNKVVIQKGSESKQ